MRFQNGAVFTGDANISASSATLAIGQTATLGSKIINVTGFSAMLGVSVEHTLTLGPNAQVTLASSNTRMSSDVFQVGIGTVVNQGTIRAAGSVGNTTWTINPDVLDKQNLVEAVNNAVLTLNGKSSWSNSGTGRAATGLKINFNGNYTQAGGGRLSIELSPQFGVFDVPGSAALDGLLELRMVGGFRPGQSQTLEIATTNGLSGALSNIVNGGRLPSVGGGVGSFQVNYGALSAFDPNSVALSAFQGSGGLLGDFNGDSQVNDVDIDVKRNAVLNSTSDSQFNVDGLGDPNIPDDDDFDHLVINIIGSGRGDGNLSLNINFDDFVILTNNYKKVNSKWREGNYNIDTVTNFNDFVELTNRYNKNCSCPSAPAGTVPEPTTVAVLGIAALI